MRFFKRAPRPARRRGVVHLSMELGKEAMHPIQFEVVEHERQGGLSRVQVVRVSGTQYGYDAAKFLPLWQKTADIAWFPEEK